MKRIWLLCTVLGLSCIEGGRADSAERIGSIRYFRDKRTDLCFAFAWGGLANGGPAMANVPCTNDVKARLGDIPSELNGFR